MSAPKKPKRSGLGRGLDALLPKTNIQDVQRLAVTQLQVSAYQPRKTIDAAALAELTQSIASKGVLQPLLVRPLAPTKTDDDVSPTSSEPSRYEIVAGERRFRAAMQAGLDSVPVVVRTLSDQETLEVAIVENLQRENLSPLEEAQAFKQLLDFGLNQEAVATSVGKSRSAIANSLRLLKLQPSAQEALTKQEISAGHARAILALPDFYQHWALEQIVSQGLSVRQAEALKLPGQPSQDVKQASASSSERPYASLEEDLTRHLGTRVSIKGEDKGKLEVHFHTVDELERLLELLGYQA
ncbi:MAG: ParB/RepB/Spo0J family partition protein [Deinococcota bacterium]